MDVALQERLVGESAYVPVPNGMREGFTQAQLSHTPRWRIFVTRANGEKAELVAFHKDADEIRRVASDFGGVGARVRLNGPGQDVEFVVEQSGKRKVSR